MCTRVRPVTPLLHDPELHTSNTKWTNGVLQMYPRTHIHMRVEGTSPSLAANSVRRLDHHAPPGAVIGADPEQGIKGGGYLGNKGWGVPRE